MGHQIRAHPLQHQVIKRRHPAHTHKHPRTRKHTHTCTHTCTRTRSCTGSPAPAPVFVVVVVSRLLNAPSTAGAVSNPTQVVSAASRRSLSCRHATPTR